MAGQLLQQAAPAVTSMAVVQQDGAECTRALCVDRDGHLYFTERNRHCVFKVHRQRGRFSAASAKVGGSADGNAVGARFSTPWGVCISPVDPDSRLVMDGRSVRAVDIVTGAARTLAPSSAGVQPARLFTCCASDGRRHVWVMDFDEGRAPSRLLWLDMRSLESHQVPLAQGCSIDTLLCTDSAGNAVCTAGGKPQLWRVQPDGTATLLAGTAQVGYRDGPAAEAQFGARLWAAAVAGDGIIVVSDPDNRRLRLVSPGGTVSTLAGSREEGARDGPVAEAQFNQLSNIALSPGGDVLVWSVDAYSTLLLRTVPGGLPPPPHLAAPLPPVHPLVALTGGLLQSGLLADAVIRVVAVRDGAPLRQAADQPAAHRGGGLAVEARIAGGGEASASQVGGSADPSSSSGTDSDAAAVDIACHSAILAAACPYFRALFAGPLAQQQLAAAIPACGSSGAAGGEHDASRGEPISCADFGEPPSAAAASAATSAVPVVTVGDASADAVRAVLCHVYTGGSDLGDVTASTAQDVLHLAQQWGLDGLLEACQAYVAEHLLGPCNAAEWLVCAHLRQYGAVRAAALRAVVEHIDAVLGDDAQVALLKQHPDLLVEAWRLARGVRRQP